MMSSTLGSNSGSQQPFMRAKHLETVSQQLHHRFHHQLLIITHQLLIARPNCFLRIGTRDVIMDDGIANPCAPMIGHTWLMSIFKEEK